MPYLFSYRFQGPALSHAAVLVSPAERAAFPRLAPVGADYFTAPCEARLQGLRETSALVDRMELAQGPAPQNSQAQIFGQGQLPKVPVLKAGDIVTDLRRQVNKLSSCLQELALNGDREGFAAEWDRVSQTAAFENLPAVQEAREVRERNDWRILGPAVTRFAEFSIANKGAREGNGGHWRQNSNRLQVINNLVSSIKGRLQVLEDDRLRQQWVETDITAVNDAIQDATCLLRYVQGRQTALRSRAFDKRGGRARGKRGGCKH